MSFPLCFIMCHSFSYCPAQVRESACPILIEAFAWIQKVVVGQSCVHIIKHKDLGLVNSFFFFLLLLLLFLALLVRPWTRGDPTLEVIGDLKKPSKNLKFHTITPGPKLWKNLSLQRISFKKVKTHRCPTWVLNGVLVIKFTEQSTFLETQVSWKDL